MLMLSIKQSRIILKGTYIKIKDILPTTLPSSFHLSRVKIGLNHKNLPIIMFSKISNTCKRIFNGNQIN